MVYEHKVINLGKGVVFYLRFKVLPSLMSCLILNSHFNIESVRLTATYLLSCFSTKPYEI